jgi:hypothetical protein
MLGKRLFHSGTTSFFDLANGVSKLWPAAPCAPAALAGDLENLIETETVVWKKPMQHR